MQKFKEPRIYCDCGAPLRVVRMGSIATHSCRLCSLDRLLPDVMVWADRSNRIEARRLYIDHLEVANSTANTPATSMWLPDGSCPPLRYGPPPMGGTSDEWRLRRWHQQADVRRGEEVAATEDREDAHYYWRTGQEPPVPFGAVEIARFHEAFTRWATERP